MRKILLAAVLAVSLPAIASAEVPADAKFSNMVTVVTYMQQGLPLAEAYKLASADCGGSCDADLFAALNAVGVDQDAIVQAAIDAGVAADVIIASSDAAGLNMSSPALKNVVASLTTDQPATAAGGESDSIQLASAPQAPTAPPVRANPPSGGAGQNPVGISPASPL